MRNNTLKIFLTVVLGCMPIAELSVLAASARTNPFLSLQEEDFYGQDYNEEITSLKLSGVFFSPGNSYAVIDGKVIREKEFIYDKEVVMISDKKVLLKNSAGAEFVLKLGNVRQKN